MPVSIPYIYHNGQLPGYALPAASSPIHPLNSELLCDVMVLDMESEPLLGMGLLLGSRLTVSCRPNGSVFIEEEEP